MEFNCPNGHGIVCPDDRAGRAAKCPKCGILMRIPAANGMTATKIAGGAQSPGPSDSTMANLRAVGDGASEDKVVFLCPNGHRLNAPARLAGQAGKCPHCGAAFLVPDQDQSGAVNEGATDDSTPGSVTSAATPGAVHPLCALVAKLWVEREQGAVVELHLEGGTIMVPDWFDAAMSGQSYGLFANQAADGTVTMTAVAWSSVLRVVVRNVEGLPEGMFE
jgi:hypothetical protein